MPHKEWEELSHEQTMKQSLRQMGISEDFVTEIVGSLIHAVFDGINSQIGRLLRLMNEESLSVLYVLKNRIKLGLLSERSKVVTFTMQL